MAVNTLPDAAIWSEDEQPSLLEEEDSLSSQAAVSGPCPAGGGEPVCTRPPRSKSKDELVIVINEKLKNGK